jgi:serine/threonine protein kinase
MTSVNAEFLYLDGTKVVERIIGIGGTGIVIQQGQYALKIPRISRDIGGDGALVTNRRLTPEEGDYDERPDLIRSIEDEKAIYRRLGDHPGIVRCYNPSSTHHSIQMVLMKNGDLQHYLAETRPGKKTQLSWLTEMAHTMAHIHNRRVIVADIRLDNLLLDNDLAVKFADFGESTLMPLDWSLDGSDDLGCSILTDIGQFGAVIFEIVTGQSCKFDIMQDWKEVEDLPTWPRRDSLPSTSDVWLGHIIEKCWTQGFRSANDLAAELNKEVAQSSE